MNAINASEVLGLLARESKDTQSLEQEAERRYKDAEKLHTIYQAKTDLVSLWGNRILDALRRGQNSADNRWSPLRRSDEPYRQALRDALGPRFKVGYQVTGWGNGYLKVEWD